MCHDGNSASLSVRYLNAQLSALWENATECVKESGSNVLDVKSQEYEKSKYTRALAQFHYLGKKAPKTISSTEDLLFYATFDKPQLKFVCNHEAVLSLTIKSGHLNLDYQKSSIAGYRADHTKNRHPKDTTVVFRVEFARSHITGRDTKIGNASSKHLIQMLILKFETAKLVTFKDDEVMHPSVQEALTFYMRRYLEFLQHAGNHVLFDLPDFDDDKFKAKIDYSLHREPINLDDLCDGVTVFSADIKDMNEYLESQWMKAASLGRPQDCLSIALAEISSSWLMNAVIDNHFHVRFGAPKVRALCSHEVILYFDIQDIAFFRNSDFSIGIPDVYHNWTIAFVVDVVEEKEGTSITRIKLDLNTARFSSYFSTYKKTDTLVITYFNRIVKFLEVDYLDILTQYSMHVIYSVDIRVSGTGFGLIGGGGSAEYESEAESANWTDSEAEEEHRTVRRAHGNVSIFTERITSMVLYNFDQILAISEESIDSQFLSMWIKATHNQFDQSLAQWSLDLFNASFHAIKVRLLSNGKAIVCINIHQGDMAIKKESERTNFWTYIGWSKPTKEEITEKFTFEELSFSFMVDLLMVEGRSLDVQESWHSRFQDSLMWNSFHDKVRFFKHLLLDFQNATFIPELSSTLLLGTGRDGLTRVETVKHYMLQYLAHLSRAGHNIIHSVPVFSSDLRISFGFTEVIHKVVTKTEVTVKNCTYRSHSSESPVILILGMCNGRSIPSFLLEWHAGWVISTRGHKSLGTVCLSREAFLEGRLLRLLAEINAKTTLVPEFAGVIDGQWKLDLTTWAQHTYRSSGNTDFKKKSGSSSHLEYVWEHRDDWNYEHQGSDEKNGEYSLSCRTKNTVHVPTLYRPGVLVIELKGTSSVKVSGKSDHVKWSKKTSASWSALISIASRASGLVVEVSGELKPIFAEDESESEGICPLNVTSLHSQHFPDVVYLDEVILTIKQALEGEWEYSAPGYQSYALINPVFNVQGDLIAQLVENKASAMVLNAPKISFSSTTIESSESTTVTESLSTASYDKLSLTTPDFVRSDSMKSSTSSLDSPPLKTPSLDPAAPSFNPKSVPGFNGLLKTLPSVAETRVEETIEEEISIHDDFSDV
ncbi:hypothetical protein PHLCEN_2v3334 [Hermanssonia centrifuga]|uniref:Uncharacterized protein n=1 Tax=Hermanssonia centrifuga TaxID=98765 RepID=A0A2R6QM86_9APHY|nr:hypothetical protein PHLCEN_2v3334 [Hermanssonia centrifuga]